MTKYMVITVLFGETKVNWCESLEEATTLHKEAVLNNNYCEVYKRTSKGYTMILD